MSSGTSRKISKGSWLLAAGAAAKHASLGSLWSSTESLATTNANRNQQTEPETPRAPAAYRGRRAGG